jgi:uncharacterized membrane protein YgcG
MKMNSCKRAVFVCCLLVQFSTQVSAQGQIPTDPASGSPPAASVQLPLQELQQLVAPIALYPDALVAQILAASTYPTEIVEADRWMQRHSGLTGDDLAKEVDKQPWDPSVKALTQFPSVLENMDKNLSWTSSLGDAYANQPQDVTDAVQVLRQQARSAGHLNSNEQEKVSTQGDTIIVEPADPEVVYVPAFDPWLVYGAPIVAYPDWYPVPGISFDGPEVSFGIGFGLGFFGGFGWGWSHWGADWHDHRVTFNHSSYISHSRTIVNRNNFNDPGLNRGNFNHGNLDHENFDHGNLSPGNAFHGPSALHAGTNSNAFSGFDHGGNARAFSFRGQSSFGGGFHGGGGVHGGGHR